MDRCSSKGLFLEMQISMGEGESEKRGWIVVVDLAQGHGSKSLEKES